MKKIVDAIKMELVDIQVKMQKLEETDVLAFKTEQWKILHAQREVLGKVLDAGEQSDMSSLI